MNGKTQNGQAGGEFDAAQWLADFRYRPQLRICDADGTCKRMTPALRATMTPNEQKQYDDIFAFQFPDIEKYNGGPRYCGKKPGICASNHCRHVHFHEAAAKAANAGAEPPAN